MKISAFSLCLFLTQSIFAADMTKHDLAPCPDSPNCVSSLSASDADSFIAPFQLSGEMVEELSRLESIMKEMRGFTIVVSKADYLRVESKTLIMRFIDDLEFLWSEQDEVLHIRSASRVGQKDFGKNRKRLEQIRLQFNPT